MSIFNVAILHSDHANQLGSSLPQNFNGPNRIVNLFVVGIWIAVALFFAFSYRFAFNFETELNHQYKLVFVLPFLAEVIFFIALFKKGGMTIFSMIALPLIILTLLLLYFSEYYNLGNGYFTVVLFVSYISIGLWLINRAEYFEFILLFLLFLFIYEEFLGISQYLSNIGYYNKGLSITEPFQNSGIKISDNKFELPSSARINFVRFFNFLAYLTALLVVTVFFKCYVEYRAANKWKYVRESYNDSNTIEKYDSLMSVLYHNGKFLTEYGIVLNKYSSSIPKGGRILESAKKYFMSYVTIDALGDAYEKEGDFSKAIKIYKWNSNFLPNLFEQKFKLMKVYMKEGDSVNIVTTANSILKMPVKIPSFQIDQMKEELTNVLKINSKWPSK